jgi:hypothetical protein
MENGGTQKLKEAVDFESDFNKFNETCTVQFLIDSIDRDLEQNLKPQEVYEAKLSEIIDHGPLDSMEKYNLINVHRLHLNEIEILKKNRDYMLKMRPNI